SLLSAVSHDLRTPLTVITGAASTLLSPTPPENPAVRRDLLTAIYDEAVRLTRLVGNLLDMTRLTAGALRVNKEWQSVEAVVGAAVRRVESQLEGRPPRVDGPAGFPLVPLHALLLGPGPLDLLQDAAQPTPAR